MIFGLSSNLDQAERSVGVAGSCGEHFQELRLANVVGTGAGDEDSTGAKHFEGAEVEFLVAAEGGIEVALRLGEGGRIENDRVITLAGGGVVLEQVEGVGFDPFDLLVTRLVEGGVLVGDFERGTGAVDAGDVRAAGSQMEGESALVAENVESLAVGVLGGGGVVLALVEEGSGLLAFEGVEVKLARRSW
jgi:hypothetical protein